MGKYTDIGHTMAHYWLKRRNNHVQSTSKTGRMHTNLEVTFQKKVKTMMYNTCTCIITALLIISFEYFCKQFIFVVTLPCFIDIIFIQKHVLFLQTFNVVYINNSLCIVYIYTIMLYHVNNVHLNDQSNITRFSASSSSPRLQLLTFQIQLCIVYHSNVILILSFINIKHRFHKNYSKNLIKYLFRKITLFASEISNSK